VVRVDLTRGRTTASRRLGGPAIAVAVGYRSVWALDSLSTLYRIDPRTARVTKRIRIQAAASYNIWIGAGSVWVAEDQAARIVRVSPTRNKVVARIRVGDGPADMAFAGGSAWVMDHRDRTLFRIETAANRATRLATIGDAEDAAPERLVLFDGSLWITGRGMPLLQVDPASGHARRSIDIRGTGIDVVAAAGAVWVPVRTLAVDRTGFPTMAAVRRVAADGTVTTAASAQGRVDVHGLVAVGRAVWLADNTDGFLYRITG
jgi:virginiamycin B lyase